MTPEHCAAVIAEARSWIGTPWHSRARVKGAGVDCAQFPAAVYEAAGLIPHIEPEYSRQWALHQAHELYIEWVLKFADEIAFEQVRTADMGVFLFDKARSHGAIFTSRDTIVHAVYGMGVFEETVEGNEQIRTRIETARFFTIRDA
jgi:cell wall-associated NlpC family hydrolase